MALDRALVIGILLFNNMTSLDFAGPGTYLEYLGVIGQKVEIHTIGEKVGPLQPSNLTPMYASVSMDNAPRAWDILIVPGGLGATPFVQNQKLVDYVRGAAENATDVLTVCTGGRIMGATGLLDGKNATTNKMEFSKIASEYPAVNWIEHARWVVEGKYWTSSGVSAGLDLGHAYVAAKFGEEAATKIQRTLEYVANKDPSNDPFAPQLL